MTLFPDSMRAVLGESIIGRAAKKGAVEINCVQIRDYTENKQMQVDDYPYGGGWGLVMMAQPLKSCLDDIMSKAGSRRSRVIYMSPQGRPFNQEEAKRLRRDYDHLVLVCGHYEGVDESLGYAYNIDEYSGFYCDASIGIRLWKFCVGIGFIHHECTGLTGEDYYNNTFEDELWTRNKFQVKIGFQW